MLSPATNDAEVGFGLGQGLFLSEGVLAILFEDDLELAVRLDDLLAPLAFPGLLAAFPRREIHNFHQFKAKKML